MPTTVDLVCIGSGPAGQRAAVQAAKLGKSVVVIERRRCLGGVCVETGTIPSKTFREAVIHATAAPTLDRPRRDAARPTAPELLSRVNRVIERETDVIERQLHRNRVDLIRGSARFHDPHT